VSVTDIYHSTIDTAVRKWSHPSTVAP